jgi:hypothetical protein
MTEKERILLNHIKTDGRGKRNASSAPVLAAWMQTNERQIRAMTRNLRLEKYPICGTPSEGYYWPVSREEGHHTDANLRSQESAVREVRTAFEDGLEALFGAERLFEEV